MNVIFEISDSQCAILQSVKNQIATRTCQLYYWKVIQEDPHFKFKKGLAKAKDVRS